MCVFEGFWTLVKGSSVVGYTFRLEHFFFSSATVHSVPLTQLTEAARCHSHCFFLLGDPAAVATK